MKFALAARVAVLALLATPWVLSSRPVTPPDASGAPAKTEKEFAPRDPAIRYGTLPNGMNYAIMRNATPKAIVALRLRVEVGSTVEADDQQGLAHFIEHMAFNGSKNVPEGEMVKILEREGLAFGADTNASTDFTQTVYRLDLPRNGDATVDLGLKLMREVTGNLTFAPAAVDRERGVILSERRVRDQFQLRQLRALIDLVAPGTPVSKRLPIGTEAVVRTAPVERLRDLYDRYYVPERTTLVVVGDIDVAAMEQKIAARWADWTAKPGLGGDTPMGTVDPSRAPVARNFVDPAIPTSISLVVARPFVAAPDTETGRRNDLLVGIGNAIVSRRIARLIESADSPIVGGAASSADLFKTVSIAAVDAIAKGDDWRAAVAAAEQAQRRAVTYGFTKAEIDEQLANTLTTYRGIAASSDTRQSAELAGNIVAAIERGERVTTPGWRLAFLDRIIPTITPETVLAAYRARWAGGGPLVLVSTKIPIAEGDQAILAALETSRKLAVAPPATETVPAFAYTKFGVPGRVVADTRIGDLGIRTVRFANGVRLNLKRTDFDHNDVRIRVRYGNGLLDLPAGKPGLAAFLPVSLGAGGLVKHSAEDFRSIFAGKRVNAAFGIGEEAFLTEATTSIDYLGPQLQFLAAFFVAPGFRAEADRQWQRIVPNIPAILSASPAAVASAELAGILSNGDSRFAYPSLDDLKARNMAELHAVVGPALASAPIEVAIVGDIDEVRTIALVGKTFGALPTRRKAAVLPPGAREVRFPASRAPVALRHNGKADEAQIVIAWPTTDDSDARTDTGLSLLADVVKLALMEQLREKLGATYSAGASSQTSSAFPGFGYLSVSSNIDASRLAEVRADMLSVVAGLRDKGIDADLLRRAKAPLRERLIQRQRENGEWLTLIDDAQTDPRWLGRWRTASATLEAINAAELQKLAQRYLTGEGALVVSILPAAAP